VRLGSVQGEAAVWSLAASVGESSRGVQRPEYQAVDRVHLAARLRHARLGTWPVKLPTSENGDGSHRSSKPPLLTLGGHAAADEIARRRLGKRERKDLGG